MQRRFGMLLALLLVPPLIAFVPGCPSGGDKDGKDKAAKKDEGKAGKDDSAKAKDGKKDGKEASKGGQVLEAKGWGTLKGKVTYKGKAPEVMKIAAMSSHKDSEVCLMGGPREVIEQQWLVSEDGGVSDVIIFLQAPGKAKLPIHEDDMKREKPAVIDQPHCVFIPHATVHYPYYTDPKTGKKMETGEKFIVKNSAKVSHNSQFTGNPLAGNQHNVTLGPGDQKELKLGKQDTEIPVKCDVHPWMKAYVWVFDHPYAVRTKEDGTFEIPRVPAGVELQVIAWHDGSGTTGYISTSEFNGKSGKKMTLKEGDNELNLEISQ